jgi:hypothetical protein
MNINLSSFTNISPDVISGGVSFFLTVALFSYLIGDNPFYRIAVHLFIGVSVGYAALVVIYQVLTPHLILPLTSGDMRVTALASVPLILFAFLILKLNPKLSAFGNISIGFLVGVGAAVAIGGAVIGTIVPQVQMTWTTGDVISRLIVAAGVITSLLSFQFWLRNEGAGGVPERTVIMRFLANIGQVFIVITLGALYGGLILSGIVIFGERAQSLVDFVRLFIP